MKEYNLLKIQDKLMEELDRERYLHTLGVMYTSASLAMRYGENVNKAQVAGLLHDCAKCVPLKQMVKLCVRNHIPISNAEEKNPFLLHAKLGAYFARVKYRVRDQDILDAIACHTTGKPRMTLLEKIIYIADYIEPWREKAPNLNEIRLMSFSDLDRTLFTIMDDTMTYLKETANVLDPMTEEAYEYYRDVVVGKER